MEPEESKGAHLIKCSPKPPESVCKGANERLCLSMGDLWLLHGNPLWKILYSVRFLVRSMVAREK